MFTENKIVSLSLVTSKLPPVYFLDLKARGLSDKARKKISLSFAL